MAVGEPTKRKVQAGSRTEMKWDNKAGRKGSGRVSIKRATLVGSRSPLVKDEELWLWLGLLVIRPAMVSSGG